MIKLFTGLKDCVYSQVIVFIITDLITDDIQG